MKITTLTLMIAFIILTSSSSTGIAGYDLTNDKILYPGERRDLVIPDFIWDEALLNTGFQNETLGYTAHEMTAYGESDYILPVVENLFRDVKSIPRFSGRLGDLLLKNKNDLALSVYLAFSLLEARAGRGIEPPKRDEWNTNLIKDGSTVDDAMGQILAVNSNGCKISTMSASNRDEWNKLPDSIKRLVIRVLVAMIEAKPFLLEAYDEQFYKTFFDVDEISVISHSELYDFASAPWRGSGEIVPSEAYDAVGKLDMKYLAYSSQVVIVNLQSALNEFWDNQTEIPSSFLGCEFETEIGMVGIFGTQNDHIVKEYAFILETGGDDWYDGDFALPLSFESPIGIVIDLAGNDKYGSNNGNSRVAVGNHGIGVLIDLNGNDEYVSGTLSQGAALYGTGLLVDYKGNDSYVCDTWGQGSGHVGAGMLIDMEGNDTYYCQKQSQGFASTYGVGIILDAMGNDKYEADPEGAISEPFGGNTVSFAQGTAFGRRADFADGHSLGGGVGCLIDGAGDDNYSGGVYCQGAGYWWALGILEDRGGNDTYNSVWYSLGSAPHFAIGVCVDFAGDDSYNIGNEDKLKCQTQGCARDGSIGIFIDGSGNDNYYHTNRCAGAGDLNSIAIFWDRCGDDHYTCNRDAPYVLDRSYGDSSQYTQFGTMRDDIPTVGIFFDTGGNDIYEELPPTERPEGYLAIEFSNNSHWRHQTGPLFWGYGIDVDQYLNEPDTQDNSSD